MATTVNGMESRSLQAKQVEVYRGALSSEQFVELQGYLLLSEEDDLDGTSRTESASKKGKGSKTFAPSNNAKTLSKLDLNPNQMRAFVRALLCMTRQWSIVVHVVDQIATLPQSERTKIGQTFRSLKSNMIALARDAETHPATAEEQSEVQPLPFFSMFFYGVILA
jgi:hypothetical protein